MPDKHTNLYPVIELVYNNGISKYISTRKGDFVEVISEIDDPDNPRGTCYYYTSDQTEVDPLPYEQPNVTEEACIWANTHPTLPHHWVQTEIGESVTYHLHPLLLNIPSISESIDVQSKKYKISSVTLNISDFEYDGERFSNTLVDSSGNSIINAQVKIYFVSQNAKAKSDFIQVGHFIVRSFTQSDSQVNLVCEDRSQAELHKDLPLQVLNQDNALTEKYSEKLFPIVYGWVDRSPVLLRKVFGINTDDVRAGAVMDSIAVNTFNGLYLRLGEDCRVRDFLIDDNELDNIYFKRWFISSGNLEKNKLQVDIYQLPTGYRLKNTDDNYETIEGGTIQYQGELINGENLLKNDMSVTEFNSGVLPESTYDLVEDPDSGLPTVQIDGYGAGLLLSFNKLDYSVPLDENGDLEDDIVTRHYIDIEESFFNQNPPDDNIPHNTVAYIDPSSDGLVYDDEEQNELLLRWGGHSNINTPYSSVLSIYPAPNATQQSTGYLKIKRFRFYQLFWVENPYSKEIYADVIGREGSTPTAYNVVNNILSEELNFNNIIPQSFAGDWSLAFTVDKRIGSKKLIEEILQSSPYYGYFKDDQFNLTAYPKPDESNVWGSVKQINADDVLSYKYDRTPIEKVVTRCKVKYHYDYGLKDYTKETDWLLASDEYQHESSVSYVNNYYGIDDHQDLEFESKYIRNEASALSLRNFLLRQYCNQHNVFTVKLPISYYDYNLTNIVTFDKLIEGRKAFGEDYTSLAVDRNGQACFNKFYVVGLKKTLDYIELKLYQIHDISGEEIIAGCMDSSANNYNPDATISDQSMCTYDAPEPDLGFCALPSGIVPNYEEAQCINEGGHWNTDSSQLSGLYGCIDPEADYPTDGAVFDDGSCTYTPQLGDFSVTNVESSWTFSELSELPNATITFQWSIPENAFYPNLTEAIFTFSIWDVDNQSFLIQNANATAISGSSNGFVIIDVSQNFTNLALDTLHNYEFRISFVNINCNPSYIQALHFPFTLTIQSEEEEIELPDLIIDTLNIYDIGYDMEIGTNEISGNTIQSKEIEFRFAVASNSPDIVLDEESSYVMLRIKWASYFNESDKAMYHAAGFKVEYNYSEQIGDGSYRIHFKAHTVYFPFWMRRGTSGAGTLIMDWEYFVAGEADTYSNLNEYALTNTAGQQQTLFLEGYKLNAICYNYSNIYNTLYYSLDQLEYYEEQGDARYMIITDLYIKDLTTDTGYRFGDPNGWVNPHYAPDFPTEQDDSYLYINPGSSLDVQHQYDFNRDGLVDEADKTLLEDFIEDMVDALYPDHGDNDLISNDDISFTIFPNNEDGTNPIDLMITAADHNGIVPIGYYCKQDLEVMLANIEDIIG